MLRESFNIFVLLELDPDERWSQEGFEKRLKEKQSEWMKLSNHPQKAFAAKRSLERMPELRRIAANDAERAQHAAEAKKLKHAEQGERRNELDVALELLQAKGHLLEAELNGLVTQYANVASESGIRERLKVPVVKGEEAPQSRKESLDPSKARDIEQKLHDLGKKDLYDFLGLNQANQPALLLDKAKALHDGVQKQANKDAAAILTSRLAGVCMQIFKTAADKELYDNSIADRAYAGLRKMMDLTTAHSKTINTVQIALLVRHAVQVGLDKDEAWMEILVSLLNKGCRCTSGLPSPGKS
jgi:hypothetical protein